MRREFPPLVVVLLNLRYSPGRFPQDPSRSWSLVRSQSPLQAPLRPSDPVAGSEDADTAFIPLPFWYWYWSQSVQHGQSPLLLDV
jgi:hypothetical protein